MRLSVLLALSLVTLPARADCTPEGHQSPCIDADGFWQPTAPSAFLSIPSARASRPGTFSARVSASLLARPVVLATQSPDPAGRELVVVDDVVDASLGVSVVPAAHLELDAVLSLAVHRTGTGLSGVTTQSSREVPSTAARDLRLGAQHDLILKPGRRRSAFGAATRIDLTLPTGDESTFAGARGVVTAPSLLMSIERGLFFAGSQVGARLRLPVELGGSRFGSQLVSSLGVGLTPLERSFTLDVSLEAWVMPVLGRAERELPDGKRTVSTQIASEWLLSARARTGDTTFALGGGGGIPLSSETRTSTQGGSAAEHFAGLTTPRWRGVATLTHAFHLDGAASQ